MIPCAGIKQLELGFDRHGRDWLYFGRPGKGVLGFELFAFELPTVTSCAIRGTQGDSE